MYPTTWPKDGAPEGIRKRSNGQGRVGYHTEFCIKHSKIRGCQNTLFCASDVQGFVYNANHIIYELQCKRYPTLCGLPHLHCLLHMPPRRLRDLGIDSTIVDSSHMILSALSDPSWGPSIYSMGHACMQSTSS